VLHPELVTLNALNVFLVSNVSILMAPSKFRTDIPENSDLDHVKYDWEYSVYGDSHEELPTNMPPPRGKPVQTTTFEDANLVTP
jgi:hypothetical protein